MPLQTIKLAPGVTAEATPVQGIAQIISSQLIRFRYAGEGVGVLPEKLGGWAKFYPLSLGSAVRALHAWEGINSDKRLAAGCTASLDVIFDGVGSDITPRTVTTNPSVDFSTTSGSNVVTIVDQQSATVTISIASPAVITWNSNPVKNGDPVFFTTSGALPTGITASTVYYVINRATNTFQIAASPGGSAINTSGSQSGTQTAHAPGIVPSVFDSIYLSTPVAVGGLVLFGSYPINSVITADSYTILAASNATSTVSHAGAVPVFTTTSGSPFVNVGLTGHGYTVGESFPVATPTTVGGITISGNYLVQAVVDANNFTIIASASATSSTSGSENGGKANFTYYVGLSPNQPPAGYGSGTYGSGAYGIGTTPTPSAGTPITATNWSLDNWGEILLACPANGPIYSWSPDSGFANAIKVATAPLINGGIFVAEPAQILVSWGSSFTGVVDPMQINWSDSGDYTNWTVSALTQAGGFRIPTGSRIVGGLQGPQTSLIWTDLALWSMDYIEPPLVFGFNSIANNCGLIGRNAMCVVNNNVMWMGASNFFILAGGTVSVIPCSVWDYVFQNLDTDNLDKITCASNANFGEVSWYWPSLSGGTGEVDSYVKVNYLNGYIWDFGTLQRTAWVDQNVLGEPIGGDASGYVYQHEISPDADGQPMLPSLTTGYFEVADGENLSFVDWVLPDFRYNYYPDQPAAVLSMQFGIADYPNDTPKIVGPYNVTSSLQAFNTRFRSRFAQITISSSDLGTFWRLGNIKIRAVPDGKR